MGKVNGKEDLVTVIFRGKGGMVYGEQKISTAPIEFSLSKGLGKIPRSRREFEVVDEEAKEKIAALDGSKEYIFESGGTQFPVKIVKDKGRVYIIEKE
ncbi:hypothetical protein [Bacillus safensis]|uniref:hypothetical protein n=1 Tax=Bacillus safensis TaxID=561879 RepID=UPI00148ECC90|nr:hypothetical protein [Bacillus safensis]NOL36765.1 hypothetical protein [Bacillus safensis]